jgi:hypothetical protein
MRARRPGGARHLQAPHRRAGGSAAPQQALPRPAPAAFMGAVARAASRASLSSMSRCTSARLGTPAPPAAVTRGSQQVASRHAGSSRQQRMAWQSANRQPCAAAKAQPPAAHAPPPAAAGHAPPAARSSSSLCRLCARTAALAITNSLAGACGHTTVPTSRPSSTAPAHTHPRKRVSDQRAGPCIRELMRGPDSRNRSGRTSSGGGAGRQCGTH